MVFARQQYLVKDAFDRWRRINRFVIQDMRNNLCSGLYIHLLLSFLTQAAITYLGTLINCII